MQDNTPNGEKLLLSLKFFAVLLAIITIADCIILAATLEDIDGRSALFMFTFFMPFFFITIVAAFISRLFWLLWIFRAEANLREVATTTFSPWIAVFFSFFPIMDAFILRDIVQNTERQLDVKQPDSPAAPINLKPVYIAFAFLAVNICCAFFLYSTHLSTTFPISITTSTIIIAGIIICLVRAIKPFLKKEQQLFQIYENEILNTLKKKVDEVLRNSKIEETAKMVQEAKFENK